MATTCPWTTTGASSRCPTSVTPRTRWLAPRSFSPAPSHPLLPLPSLTQNLPTATRLRARCTQTRSRHASTAPSWRPSSTVSCPPRGLGPAPRTTTPPARRFRAHSRASWVSRARSRRTTRECTWRGRARSPPWHPRRCSRSACSPPCCPRSRAPPAAAVTPTKIARVPRARPTASRVTATTSASVGSVCVLQCTCTTPSPPASSALRMALRGASLTPPCPTGPSPTGARCRQRFGTTPPPQRRAWPSPLSASLLAGPRMQQSCSAAWRWRLLSRVCAPIASPRSP
mmetsp:Transcript_4401/g.12906  ORF Transcript_4401/g.12906 Transcript_4401/m.12906 type:complete len:286 (+) Transcript_4401:1690-2547(+)